MRDKQKKSPDAVTTRTGKNSRNSQTADIKIITQSDLDEQLSELTKMLRALLDLIEDEPHFEVIERHQFGSVSDNALKGDAV